MWNTHSKRPADREKNTITVTLQHVRTIANFHLFPTHVTPPVHLNAVRSHEGVDAVDDVFGRSRDSTKRRVHSEPAEPFGDREPATLQKEQVLLFAPKQRSPTQQICRWVPNLRARRCDGTGKVARFVAMVGWSDVNDGGFRAFCFEDCGSNWPHSRGRDI